MHEHVRVWYLPLYLHMTEYSWVEPLGSSCLNVSVVAKHPLFAFPDTVLLVINCGMKRDLH